MTKKTVKKSERKSVSKKAPKKVAKKTKTPAKKKGKKPVKKTLKKIKDAVKKATSKLIGPPQDQTPPPNPNFKIQTIKDLGIDRLDHEYYEATMKFISENKAGERDMEKLKKDAYDVCHPPYAEKLNQIMKDKLGVSLIEMKEVLSKKTIERAQDLTVEMKNIAPYADYSKLIENNDEMAEFMRTEGHKWENWKVKSIAQDPKFTPLLKVQFQNSSVDEGSTIFGTVFVSKSGIVRHSMVQASE